MSLLRGEMAVDLFKSIVGDIVQDLSLIPDALVIIILIDESLRQLILKLLQLDPLYIPKIQHTHRIPLKSFLGNKHSMLIFQCKNNNHTKEIFKAILITPYLFDRKLIKSKVG